MDVRVLRYFLAIAREESFSRAAEALHLTQPTLSRQIRELEEELGVSLFERSSHAVLLTRDGLRLRKRAQELIDLMDRTTEEFSAPPTELSGDVYIGCGEAHGMLAVAQLMAQARREHPGLRFHLHSGNAEDVTDRLDRGLVDFGVLLEPVNLTRYEHLRLPGEEVWGLILREDHPLCAKAAVTLEDACAVPLILSGQAAHGTNLLASLGADPTQLNIAATYNLLYNAAALVREGVGCALALDRLLDPVSHSGLVFRPLTPRTTSFLTVVWKKYPVFSPAAEELLRRLKANFSGSAL